MSIGFGVEQIGTAFGIILVVSGLIGTYGGGRLCARLSATAVEPRIAALRFTAFSTLLAAPLVAFAFSTTDRTVFLTACFFAELLVFAGTAPLNTVIVQSAPIGLVTFTQGVTILAINLLGFLPAPLCIGALADLSGSLSVGLQITALALVGAAAVWLKGPEVCEGRRCSGG